MLVEFFEKLKKPKWLPSFGMTPFMLIPVVIMFRGEVSEGVGLFAFFASIWSGIFLSPRIAKFVSTHIFRVPDKVTKRLTPVLSAFGFLFIPPLVASFTNANLGTEFEMQSLSTYFFWACFGAVVIFVILGASKM